MNFLTMGLKQTCTYWEPNGVDGYNKPSFAAPVTLKCRWEERTEKIQSDEGVEVLSRARIFLDQDVKVGGYLLLGESTDSSPLYVPNAFRIITFRKTPGLIGDEAERKCYL